MDMEMDIPAPEELEWLETNALLPEEADGEEEFMVEEDIGGGELDRPEIPTLKITDPPAEIEGQASRKRHCSDENKDSGAPGNGEKGVKRRALEEEEEEPDEDWLRCSPPEDTVADMAPEADDPAPAVSQEKTLSRFASEIEGDCIPVTGPNGDRVYAKMSSGDKGEGQRKLIKEKHHKGLLLEPITALIKRVEQETFVEALEECAGSPSNQIHSTIPNVNEQLWVEKYAPNSFTELLSDEQTNREVLLWLKQWDSCVFGSQIRSTTDDVLSALRQHSSILSQKKDSYKSSFFSKNKRGSFSSQSFQSKARDTEYDNLNGFSELRSRKSMCNHPQEQKVLLLCGPPGLGKTTLAHVAAKHCGYRAVEINASDDRSSSTIESKILDVVQMNSVMGDSKPKCLVIDEIDGALGEGKGAVEVILALIAADKKSNPEKENADKEVQRVKASVKKGHRNATLLRPVICICNDLYAPALRPLRQVAKVHIFVQPTVSRVVNRLKYICKKEGFKTNSIALSALAEYTECDIRACLNTLQFLNKKKEALNILEVGSQIVGRKDMSRSAFDVWKEVFQKRKSKRVRKSINSCHGQADFDLLHSLLSNRGEYELIMDGIYENFLRLSYHDPMLQKTVKCLDLLGVSDSLLQFILRTQQLPLHAYQPSIAITMSYLIAQVAKPNIEWPKSLQRCRTMLTERKDMLKIWENKISPFISRHISTESFAEDIVSLFLHILSPPTLRPAALHLLSDKEKDDLAELVDTMVLYSVTYKNSKSESKQKTDRGGGASDVPVLSLEPPIDELINFKDYRSDHAGLSLAMKQVLVHEVEKQKILRENTGRLRDPPNESNTENQTSPFLTSKMPASVEGISKPKPESLQKQNIASSVPKSQLEVNKKSGASGNNSQGPGNPRRPCNRSFSFFDRIRKGRSHMDSKNPGDTLQKAATTERDSRPLLFKYNEGFTNAVKRPVKIRELL